jgi:probable biosynthetic protein (TIGR04098 family)
MTSTSDQILAILHEEIPGLLQSDLQVPITELEIDSFGLVSLRARLESFMKREIDDAKWVSIKTFSELISVATGGEPESKNGKPSVSERRTYLLNMPQMALGGMSESWLFKEIGDLHWSMITKGLKSPSSELRDGSGARLYATFTRIRVELTRPLALYRENETIEFCGNISRFGAGMFFSDTTIGDTGRCTLMSSFSRRGEAGSNTSLLKGQPDIPSDCAISQLDAAPEFGKEYRERRSTAPASPVFECEYQIIPPHDINGVGLVYFAAYPMIADICEMQHSGRDAAFRYATRARDVFYFKNSDPDDVLIYRLHKIESSGPTIMLESSISRKSDGVMMAYLMTTKDRIDANA